MVARRKYDREEWVPKLCDELAKGGKPLTVICREMGIPRDTVKEWRRVDPEINARFDDAFEAGCDELAAECIVISDTPQEGTEIVESKRGREVHTGDMLGHRKLRIWTRTQLLAKWSKRYGDRMALTGPDGGAIKLETLVTTDQAAAVLQEGLRALEKPGSGS